MIKQYTVRREITDLFKGTNYFSAHTNTCHVKAYLVLAFLKSGNTWFLIYDFLIFK